MYEEKDGEKYSVDMHGKPDAQNALNAATRVNLPVQGWKATKPMEIVSLEV